MAGAQEIGEARDNPVGVNVTALVDIIFCLCLFFMCAFHFKPLEGKLDSWLPKHGIHASPAPSLLPDEIRVVLRDGAAGVERRVRHFELAANDPELEAQIRAAANGFAADGKSDVPLVLDATPHVPWNEVVRVLDLGRELGIARIEFAAPESPIGE